MRDLSNLGPCGPSWEPSPTLGFECLLRNYRPWVFLAGFAYFLDPKNGPSRWKWMMRLDEDLRENETIGHAGSPGCTVKWRLSKHTHTPKVPSSSPLLPPWCTLVFDFSIWFSFIKLISWLLTYCNLYFKKRWPNRWFVLGGDGGRRCSWVMEPGWVMPLWSRLAVHSEGSQQSRQSDCLSPWTLELKIIKQ